MPQSDLAIQAALNLDWDTAIKINRTIIKKNPSDIDALNRLGYAYLSVGNHKKAKTTFEKVLKLDQYNIIAAKNLKKVKNNYQKLPNLCNTISPKIFLEEPGITKTINLVNLAPRAIITSLHCGQKVNIILRKNRIEIRNEDIYLGALPDDLTFRLRRLILLGNEYCAFTKAVDENQLTIIVREIKRGKRVKDASFIVKLVPDYHTSIRSEILEELLEDDSSFPETEAPEEK